MRVQMGKLNRSVESLLSLFKALRVSLIQTTSSSRSIFKKVSAFLKEQLSAEVVICYNYRVWVQHCILQYACMNSPEFPVPQAKKPHDSSTKRRRYYWHLSQPRQASAHASYWWCQAPESGSASVANGTVDQSREDGPQTHQIPLDRWGVGQVPGLQEVHSWWA